MVIIPVMSFKSERLSAESLEALPPKKHLFYTNGLMLIIGAMLVLTFWNINERPWEKIGFTWPTIDRNLVLLLLIMLVFYFSDVLYSWLNKKYRDDKLDELSYLMPLNWKEYGHFTFLAVAAGISEEIIFRAFLMAYLENYLNGLVYSTMLVILLPAVVFSVSHLYQGWWAVLKIFVLASLFGLIYIYSGSLYLVIIIHILIDLISGLLGIGRDLQRQGNE